MTSRREKTRSQPPKPVAEKEGELTVPGPNAKELARRRLLIAQILEKRKERRIAPLTSADLVAKGRTWETTAPSQ